MGELEAAVNRVQSTLMDHAMLPFAFQGLKAVSCATSSYFFMVERLEITHLESMILVGQ